MKLCNEFIKLNLIKIIVNKNKLRKINFCFFLYNLYFFCKCKKFIKKNKIIKFNISIISQLHQPPQNNSTFAQKQPSIVDITNIIVVKHKCFCLLWKYFFVKKK